MISPQLKIWSLRLFKLLIIVGLIWGTHNTWQKANAQLATQQFAWQAVHLSWIVWAGAIYLIGQPPAAWFWYRVLCDLGQKPPCYAAIRAHVIGHLGKYVPGKALVVVLRAALVRHFNVQTGAAVAAVFYETFCSMALGALSAAVILACRFDWSSIASWHWPTDWMALREAIFAAAPTHDEAARDPRMLLLALGLSCLTLPPTLPVVFRWLVGRLKAVRTARDEPLTPSESVKQHFHVSTQTILSGALAILLGWVLMGSSLLITIAAVGGPAIDFVTNGPLAIACTALAIVAGFISLIPGGLGVRELVFLLLLGPLVHNELLVVVVPIVLRVEWLLAELLAAGLLYLIQPARITVKE
jgi:uncharacterized membrane protein YbhN (UPF0104 family)